MLLIGHQPDQDGEVVIWVIRDLINANTSKFVNIKKDKQIAKYLISIVMKATYQKGGKGQNVQIPL